VERVVCATEPADEALLFKLFFARGYYEAVRGNEAAATRAFRTSRNLRPDSPWDMDYPPEDGETLFDAAQDGESVRVGFSPVPGSLVVDGTRREVPRTTLDLSSGQHVLQFGQGDPLHSTMLFDPDRLPVLVVPGLLPVDGVAWVAPELAPDLATILGRVLPGDAELWVVTDEALHHAPLRELAWERIERPPPPPPPPEPEPVVEKRRPSWARWVAVGATGVALGGLGAAGVTKLQADGLQVTDTSDPDADRYERLRGAHVASWVVAGSSGGVALGALYLDVALGGR
jgi:hypothetical protein